MVRRRRLRVNHRGCSVENLRDMLPRPAPNGQGSRRAVIARSSKLGEAIYQRLDAPATAEEQSISARLSPRDVTISDLAGQPVMAVLQGRGPPAPNPGRSARGDSPRTRRAEVIETTPGAVPGIAHLARQTRYGFS